MMGHSRPGPLGAVSGLSGFSVILPSTLILQNNLAERVALPCHRWRNRHEKCNAPWVAIWTLQLSNFSALNGRRSEARALGSLSPALETGCV